MSSGEIHSCIGFLKQQASRAFFAVPLFSGGTSEELFMQDIDPVTGLVDGFHPTVVSLNEIQKVEAEKLTSVGLPPLLVLVYDNKHFVGTVKDLASIVEAIPEKRRHRSFNLIVSQLYGKPLAKQKARDELLHKISSVNQSHINERVFLKTLFLESLWDNIVRFRKTGPGVDDDLRSLYHLVLVTAQAGPDDIFIPETWALLAPLVKLDHHELRSRVWSEMPEGAQDQLAAEPPTDSDISEREIKNFIYRLEGVSRQEERVSIVLREVLTNYRFGSAVTMKYQDRSRLAGLGINLLRHNMDLFSGEDAGFYAAEIVTRLIKEAISFDRGALLVHLAKYLGDVPEVADRIRSYVGRSQAFDILARETQILGSLKPGTPRKPRTHLQGDLFDNIGI